MLCFAFGHRKTESFEHTCIYYIIMWLKTENTARVACFLCDNFECYIRDTVFPLIKWDPSKFVWTPNSRMKGSLGSLLKVSTENPDGNFLLN